MSAVEDFIGSVIGCEESSNRPADIVILDQHIELNGGESLVLGTRIAHDLRLRHYEGLVLIRSANSNTIDCENYMSSGDVDGCLGKSQSHTELVQSIAKAYWEKQEKTSSVSSGRSEVRTAELLRRGDSCHSRKKDGTNFEYT